MRLDHDRLCAQGMQKGAFNYINVADNGLLGDKKYIIEAGWWRRWCDYVNFTQEVTPVKSKPFLSKLPAES